MSRYNKLALLVFIFLLVSLVSSIQHDFDNDPDNPSLTDFGQAPLMSEQHVSNRDSELPQSELAQDAVDSDDSGPHDDDNEPMVYYTPFDYKTWAHEERARMLASGTDPSMVILQSEVKDHIPRQEGESPRDFAKRYSNTMNDMIRRGVAILNDQCTGDMIASGFGAADGRAFDLGPGSGATKGEFREFSRWFTEHAEGEIPEVPEKWKKFEKEEREEPHPRRSGN